MSTLIVAPYYNWQYGREHGFRDWLIWGEITPTIEALIWPYFAVRSAKPTDAGKSISALSQGQINEMNIMSAKRALAASLQGNYILNSRTPDSHLTPDQLQRVVEYSLQSLQSVDATDEETLNKLYPEFGTRFKRDFGEGLRLFVSGIRNRSSDDLVKSRNLDGAWRDWYNGNRKQVEDAFNDALQK